MWMRFQPGEGPCRPCYWENQWIICSSSFVDSSTDNESITEAEDLHKVHDNSLQFSLSISAILCINASVDFDPGHSWIHSFEQWGRVHHKSSIKMPLSIINYWLHYAFWVLLPLWRFRFLGISLPCWMW